MNIFILDKNPKLAAQYQCDKHVVKMVLETAQLLSCAHHVCVSNIDKKLIYKQTHVNHPCSKWVRYSLDNYNWLCEHGIELCKEYTYRYNNIHKCENIIKYMTTLSPLIVSKGLTKPALAMPDEFKQESVVKSYRQYYVYKSKILKKFSFSKRSVPKWLMKKTQIVV